MPSKKRKRKQPTQSQRQSQKVIVNIGSKSAPRKRSGRGGLPPPSYMHNLAPTFVTAPQVDYTPILAMLTQQTRSLQPEPVRNPVTPLSAVIATQTAEQMAGEAAQRRAGPTAANFQPQPSLADERRIETLLQSSRPQPSKPKTNMVERRSMGAEDRDAPQQALRPPIPYVTQQLVPLKSAEPFERGVGAGGGIPTAESRPAVGRPKKGTQQAVPLGQQTLAAEKPKKDKSKDKSKGKSKDITTLI
jgi:hypothetical protein